MNKLTDQKKAFIYAAIAVFFWSTVPTVFKTGLRYQDNYQMVTGAAIISTFFLGFTLIAQRKLPLFKGLTRKNLVYCAILGFLNPALYYVILFKAYELLPGQVAQPLNMTWPIVLVIISIPLLKQKISGKSILSMIISFVGVAMLSFQDGNIFSAESGFKGILLALITAFIWAFYWIYNMKNTLDEVLGLFLVFLFSTCYLLIGAIFRDTGLPAGPEAWIASAYIGIFEMGLTFVLWLKALQLSVTTARISNLVFIAPFLNLIFVNIFLDESIYISTILGIIFVVAGIVIQNSSKPVHA